MVGSWFDWISIADPERDMTRTPPSLLSLAVMLCLVPACLESNPQPSPGGGGEGTVQTGDVADRVAADLRAADTGPVDGAVMDQTSDGAVMDQTSDGAVIDLTDDGGGPDGSSCGGVPPSCDLCQAPYPGCTCMDGSWVCVQCTDDSHCGEGCTCDLTLFSCAVSCSPPDCTEDSDCTVEGGPALLCHVESGTCYDPDGPCDDVSAMCLPGPATACVDLLGNDALPGSPMANLCACQDPISIGEVAECLPLGTCPENAACFPGQACTEIDLRGMILEGCPDPAYGGGICIGSGLLEGIGLE